MLFLAPLLFRLVVGVYPIGREVVWSLPNTIKTRRTGMDARTRTDQISLVIPAFNEGEVIAQAIREAQAALTGLFSAFEVLVVDDGSSDDTSRVVERSLRSAPQTRLLRHPANRGYGAALRTGFEAARFGLVAFTDADCQFDINDLATLASLAADYPVVVGYRVGRKDPWQRRFFSWGYNRLARLLLGTRVRDVDCALKVFHRDALAQLLPVSSGYFVNSEMMTRARQMGFVVAESPVSHRPRSSGASKVSLREIPQTATILLRFWWSQVVRRSKTVPVNPAVFRARVVPSEVHAPDPAPAPSNSQGRPVAPRGRRRGAA